MLTPGVGLPETAKFRGLRLRLQSALLRALRPYWWQQRTLHSMLLDAIVGLDQSRGQQIDLHHRSVKEQLALTQDLLNTFAARILALDKRVEESTHTQEAAILHQWNTLDREEGAPAICSASSGASGGASRRCLTA